MLDDHASDSNHKKALGITNSLVARYWQASAMADETQTYYLKMTSIVEAERVNTWEDEILKAKLMREADLTVMDIYRARVPDQLLDDTSSGLGLGSAMPISPVHQWIQFALMVEEKQTVFGDSPVSQPMLMVNLLNRNGKKSEVEFNIDMEADIDREADIDPSASASASAAPVILDPSEDVPIPIEQKIISLPSNGNVEGIFKAIELPFRINQAKTYLNQLWDLISEKLFQYSHVVWAAPRNELVRWQEELILVTYEMQWTVCYFVQAREWTLGLPNVDVSAGAKAYATRQETIWRRLASAADRAFQQMFVLSYVGAASTVGQVINVPIIIRSLAATMAHVAEEHLPMAFHPNLLAVLDVGTDNDKPTCLVDSYALACDVRMSVDEEDRLTDLAGLSADDMTADIPSANVPMSNMPIHLADCLRCRSLETLSHNILAELHGILQFATSMEVSTSSRSNVSMRRAAGFHLLHEHALLTESASAPVLDISTSSSTSALHTSKRIKHPWTTKQKSQQVTHNATAELQRLRSLPANSYKWVWGTDLTEADVRNIIPIAIQEQGIHSGYNVSLPHGWQLGYDTPTASAHASAQTTTAAFTSLAPDIVSIPELPQAMLDPAMAATNAWMACQQSDAEIGPFNPDADLEPGSNAESMAVALTSPNAESMAIALTSPNAGPMPCKDPLSKADVLAVADAWPVSESEEASDESEPKYRAEEETPSKADAWPVSESEETTEPGYQAEEETLSKADAWPASASKPESVGNPKAPISKADVLAAATAWPVSESKDTSDKSEPEYRAKQETPANAWPVSESEESSAESEPEFRAKEERLAKDPISKADALAAANAWPASESKESSDQSEPECGAKEETLSMADALAAANAWPASESEDTTPEAQANPCPASGHSFNNNAQDEALAAANAWPIADAFEDDGADSNNASQAEAMLASTVHAQVSLAAANAWLISDESKHDNADSHTTSQADAGSHANIGLVSNAEANAFTAANAWPLDDNSNHANKVTTLDAAGAWLYAESDDDQVANIGQDADTARSATAGPDPHLISAEDVADVWPDDNDDEGEKDEEDEVEQDDVHSAGLSSSPSAATDLLTTRLSQITIPQCIYGPDDFSYVDESWLVDADDEGSDLEDSLG
ncbi:hypothetical protein BYT27DRAFT_7213409 [Phlegmacium glaucopus]|nr:hypothetical protein BYT27DRAFT_7213409 [Phlegmacium glaucopus]